MKPLDFYMGAMIVDDDPNIVAQHQMLLDNRDLRRQTPGKAYEILKNTGLVQPVESIDGMLKEGVWPKKSDIQGTVNLNPHNPDLSSVIEVDNAYSAEDAKQIWGKKKGIYLQNAGLYVVLLDHDMPGQTGLELAKEWRPKASGSSERDYSKSPIIVFYTGKSQMLQDALGEEGYNPALERVSSTGLAEGVLQKGVTNEEFNNMLWSLLEMKARQISSQR